MMNYLGMTMVDALVAYAKEGAYTTKSDAFVKERAIFALEPCEAAHGSVVRLAEATDTALWLGCEKDGVPALLWFTRVSGVSLRGKAYEPLDWRKHVGCPACGQPQVDPSWNPTEATRFGGKVIARLEANAPANLAAIQGVPSKQETVLIELPNAMYDAWTRAIDPKNSEPWKLLKFKEKEGSAADATFRRLQHFFKWSEAAKKGGKFGGLDAKVITPVPVQAERNWDAIVVITNIAADGETL